MREEGPGGCGEVATAEVGRHPTKATAHLSYRLMPQSHSGHRLVQANPSSSQHHPRRNHGKSWLPQIESVTHSSCPVLPEAVPVLFRLRHC